MRPGGRAPARTATAPRCGFRSQRVQHRLVLAAGHLQGPVMTVTQLRTTPFLWYRQSTERRGRAEASGGGGNGLGLDVVRVDLGRRDRRVVRRVRRTGLLEHVGVLGQRGIVGGAGDRVRVDRLGRGGRRGLLLHDERDRRYLVVLADVHEPEALSVAAERAEVTHRDALDHAVLGDEHELVVLAHHERAGEAALGLRLLDRLDTLGAAVGLAIVTDQRALAEAVVG